MHVRHMGEYFDLKFKSYHSKTWRKVKAQRRKARPKLAPDPQKQKLRKKMAAFNKGDDGDEDESRYRTLLRLWRVCISRRKQ